jgi:hypothetical protein
LRSSWKPTFSADANSDCQAHRKEGTCTLNSKKNTE